MSYATDGLVLGTLTASGDQDNNQYKFVRLAGTAGLFELANGASGPRPIGVLQNDPQNGLAGEIKLSGVTPLWCDASTAIAYADLITCGSDGAGVVAATAGSNNYFGMALQAISSGCELISVLLMSGQVAADNTP